jgi:hypothetical protein
LAGLSGPLLAQKSWLIFAINMIATCACFTGARALFRLHLRELGVFSYCGFTARRSYPHAISKTYGTQHCRYGSESGAKNEGQLVAPVERDD